LILKKKSDVDDKSLDLYLKQIGETAILSHKEETRLARKYKSGDKSVRNALVKPNLRFVVSIAKQYQNQGISLQDLINDGNIGLIKAVERFDETRGFRLISYAVWWIRQSILQALAEQSRIVRLPLNRVGVLNKTGKASKNLQQILGRDPSEQEIAFELGLTEKEVAETLTIGDSHLSLDSPINDNDGSLVDVLEDSNQSSPDDELFRDSLRVEIDKVLCSLTSKEAEVIYLYFGFSGQKSMTLEEIGEIKSLTRERIRQIKKKAIRRLRHASRSRILRDYFFDIDA
jgi:RNA polymerase primary sigma factor